jgi:hypothetical protein
MWPAFHFKNNIKFFESQLVRARGELNFISSARICHYKPSLKAGDMASRVPSHSVKPYTLFEN